MLGRKMSITMLKIKQVSEQLTQADLR